METNQICIKVLQDQKALLITRTTVALEYGGNDGCFRTEH